MSAFEWQERLSRSPVLVDMSRGYDPPVVHDFQRAAKIGGSIIWGHEGTVDYTLRVRPDNKLAWVCTASSIRFLAKEYKQTIDAIDADCRNGQISPAQRQQFLAQVFQDLNDEIPWMIGDATPALDQYAREITEQSNLPVGIVLEVV